MFRKIIAALTVGMALGVGAVWAGPNNGPDMPFDLGFDSYANGPIPEGTDGWYPSSTNIVVQDTVKNKENKAAEIPVDCILSNQFTNTAGIGTVWVDMEIRPSFYDGTNYPAVDTNAAIMFYLDTNGNFVVRDGPEGTGSWVPCEDFDVNTSGTEWVRIAIKEDFTLHTWDLYASNSLSTSMELVAANLDFINNTIDAFTGFDVYSGSSTSYVEKAGVSETMPFTLDAVVDPIAANHTLGDTVNLTITVTPNGNTVNNLTVDGAPLSAGTDYIVSGDDYTIQAAYLNTQTVTNLAIVFEMSGDANPTTTVAIVDADHTSLGYLPNLTVSQTLTITNTFEYPTAKTLAALYLTNALPTGWTIDTNSFTCNDAGAAAEWVVDEYGNQLTFTTLPLTENPVIFTYDVIIPDSESLTKEIYSTIGYRFVGDSDAWEGPVQPNPLEIDPATLIRVEDAADGSGDVVAAQSVAAGSSITVYSIARTADSNFVALVTNATWTMENETGVSDTDIVGNGDGSATFTGHIVGSGNIQAASGDLTPVQSGLITVTAGDPDHLAFDVQPTTAQAGAAIAPSVTVQVLDANTNVVIGYVGNIVMTIANNPGSSVLSGTATQAVSSGVATFGDLSLNKVGTGYTLSADDEGALNAVTSTAFDIIPGDPDHLAFLQQPTTAQAGAAISPAVTVQVLDANTNVVTGYSGNIVMTIANNPGSSVLSGTATQLVSSGVATFGDLSLNKVGTGYTLSADDDGGALDAVTSTAFNITAGGADHLAFLQQPTDEQAGAAIAPSVTVQVLDANTNVVIGYVGNIVMTIANNPGSSVLSGTATQAVSSGVATFGDLSLNKVGTGYTLSADDEDGLAAVTSTAFNITPGAASQLLVITQPVGGINGQVLETQPVIGIYDANTNLVTSDDTTVVTVAIDSGIGGTLGGDVDVTAVDGVITFTDVTLTGTLGENYILEFTSVPSYTAVLSDPVTLKEGAVTTQASPGYRSPAIAGLTVTNSIVNTNFDFDYLVWTPTFPDAGWTLNSVDGDNIPAIVGSDIVFTGPFGTSVVFAYTVDIPGNAAVSNVIGGDVSYSYVGYDTTNTAPVTELTVFRYHSSDYRSPTRRIDAQELSYALAYWREGAYMPKSTTRDGYTTVASYAGDTNQGLHSADFQSDFWVLDATEVNKVLDYWRTGGYHVDQSEPDGYSSTTNGPGPAKYLALKPIVALTGPDTYVAGETVTLTATMFAPNGKVGGLAWLPELPEGWEVLDVEGDGAPELQRGEALCLAQVLPAAATAKITVKVPADAEGTLTLGTKANVIVDGRSATISANTLTVAPVVSDPVDPEDPVDPDPVDPADPVDPVDPVDPEDPVDPDPVDPEDDEEEALPVKAAAGTDFDGDGLADPCTYDENTGVWQVMLSGSGYALAEKQLGGLGWAAAPADYDGDGLGDLAVYEADTGSWSAMLSGAGYAQSDLAEFLGGVGSLPAAADYDGDGLADPAVMDGAGEVSVKLSAQKYALARKALRQNSGSPLAPACADYDGDGLADPGTYDAAAGVWTVWMSKAGYAPVTQVFGGEGWEAAPGDYDGDGLADLAVRKADGTGAWQVMLSSEGYAARAMQMGL